MAGGAGLRRRVRRQLAVGGRCVDLRTPGGRYEDVYLPLHGRHQADNFVAALAGAEAFFGRPLEPRHRGRGGRYGQLARPARGGRASGPLVVLDGAKNVAGAEASAAAVQRGVRRRRAPAILVVGMLSGKDAVEMLAALDAAKRPAGGDLPAAVAPRPAGRGRCRAPPGRSAAGRVATGSVAEALEVALAEAEDDDLVLVTGSLYTVGAARTALVGDRGLEAGQRLN